MDATAIVCTSLSGPRPLPLSSARRFTSLVVLTLLVACAFAPPLAQGQVPSSERDVLTSLFNSTSGAGWTLTALRRLHKARHELPSNSLRVVRRNGQASRWR